jgi:hypothetical protein
VVDRSTSDLVREIVRARADLLRVRHLHSARLDTLSSVELAREQLVAALDAYAARLVAEGFPVPYRLRDELRLHGGLVVSRRR